MKALWLAALAAIAGLGFQAPDGLPRLVVIIDADAPAADPALAARLRDLLLSGLDQGARPVYVELTGDAARAVPDAEAASFSRTTFTVTPPTYGGLSVTFAEGVETLRGNEAVRDGVVDRECPVGTPGDCRARVQPAVNAMVRDTEAASARKLRNVVATAAAHPGARMVLVTAGWPARDASRVALNRALGQLRTLGTSLVVVHVPAREPYQGLVRDASELLAAQLPAQFVPLDIESDLERARVVVTAGLAVGRAATGPVQAAPSEPSAAAASPPPAALPTVEPAPAPVVATAPAPSEPTLSDPTALDPTLSDDTLRRAADYVGRFERTFAAILWHERYEQEVRTWRRFGSSGTRTSTLSGRRTLESELLFVWLPRDATWLSVRDVIAIDGAPQPDRQLPALQAGATMSLLELRALARGNGRFNIGEIVRTFNEPTLALLFLDEHYRARFRFARQKTQAVAGRRVATYGFVEHARPTVIRSGERDVPVHGTLSIEDTTGRVVQTTIEMVEPLGGLSGRMTVDYSPHVAFDVLVPSEMREAYTSAMAEEITAVATYSNFRRFETAGRIIVPK